jgi:hypothetical protein
MNFERDTNIAFVITYGVIKLRQWFYDVAMHPDELAALRQILVDSGMRIFSKLVLVHKSRCMYLLNSELVVWDMDRNNDIMHVCIRGQFEDEPMICSMWG